MSRVKNLLIIAVLGLFNLNAMAGSVGAIRTAGDIGQIALPAIAGLSTVLLKDKTGFWQFTKSFVTTLGVVYIMKPIVKRKRPDGGTNSFPSGHTASAFAGAAFIQRRYGWSYGLPAYAVATFVGVSRVVARRHWTTDVLAGAAIGILSNYIFTTRYHKVQVVPYVGEHSLGLALNIPC